MESFGLKLLNAIRIALRIMTGSPCTCLIKVLYCSKALGAWVMGIPVKDMFRSVVIVHFLRQQMFKCYIFLTKTEELTR